MILKLFKADQKSVARQAKKKNLGNMWIDAAINALEEKHGKQNVEIVSVFDNKINQMKMKG